MSDSLLIETFLDVYGGYFCVLDSKGVVLRISDPFARLLSGKSREFVVGTLVTDTVTDCAELKTFFLDLFSKQEQYVSPVRIVQPVHRNGVKPIWIKLDIQRVAFPSVGECLCLSGIDITDEVTTATIAEKKSRERNEFLMKMGHELRTPLNAVLGYAKLLSDFEGLPITAKNYVSTILNHETNLLRLLSDVLEYSKFDSGQSSPMLSDTDIRRLVQDVTKTYIEQFNERFVSLTVDYSSNIPESIQTDSGKVAHVLSNLLANALKYTKKGNVTVTVSLNRLLTIDVEDTGIGIPPTDQTGLFDVFSHDGQANDISITGISLAVCRIFARMLGGDVELVRSDSGRGSLFRFTFEAQTTQATKRHVQQITDYTEIQGISRPCRVLLVDDVDINLAMLEIFLAPAGFDVSIASNGNEAVRIFKQFKPDIVFMDLIMPEKDGFEATREIKALDQSVPVIALTASIVDSVKEQALISGVNDFMYKPFIPERFFEIIAEHTGLTYRLT